MDELTLAVDGNLLCWDCHEPVAEDEAHRVRAMPLVPKWMLSSTTLVCSSCRDKRPDSVEVGEA